MALRVSTVFALVVLSASSSVALSEVDETCALESEDSCMLQHAAQKKADVTCTYSSTKCQGDQCCPRAKETGNLTYPCPSASVTFRGCENNTHPILGIFDPWFGLLVQLHGSGRMEHLQFFSEAAEMEASMADAARESKASILRTPYSLFGQHATHVAGVRVRPGDVLFSCHNLEQMTPELTDRRFANPEYLASPMDSKALSQTKGAKGICHSMPAAPERMQYVMLEKEDGSRVRVMQECHTHGMITEMCHASELVVVNIDALRELDIQLSKAAEQQ